jgi:hypothetical protein
MSRFLKNFEKKSKKSKKLQKLNILAKKLMKSHNFDKAAKIFCTRIVFTIFSKLKQLLKVILSSFVMNCSQKGKILITLILTTRIA